jgi:predicted RNase H-like HicB family nuclease
MTTTTYSSERGGTGTTGTWTAGEDRNTNGASKAVTQRELPPNLLQEYARLAVRGAELNRREDGSWFAEIPSFEGVWANEASHAEALDALEEVLFDWAILKIKNEDRDLPIVEGIDLNEL